jgi:hypothetical protein
LFAFELSDSIFALVSFNSATAQEFFKVSALTMASSASFRACSFVLIKSAKELKS